MGNLYSYSFMQVTSNSVLAALYSSEGSVMERHHFAQTMCILNTEGCNIFETLDKSDYIECLDLLRDIILGKKLKRNLEQTCSSLEAVHMDVNEYIDHYQFHKHWAPFFTTNSLTLGTFFHHKFANIVHLFSPLN